MSKARAHKKKGGGLVKAGAALGPRASRRRCLRRAGLAVHLRMKDSSRTSRARATRLSGTPPSKVSSSVYTTSTVPSKLDWVTIPLYLVVAAAEVDLGSFVGMTDKQHCRSLGRPLFQSLYLLGIVLSGPVDMYSFPHKLFCGINMVIALSCTPRDLKRVPQPPGAMHPTGTVSHWGMAEPGKAQGWEHQKQRCAHCAHKWWRSVSIRRNKEGGPKLK